MPWVKRKADEHRCQTPDVQRVRDAAPGDIWECNECRQRWQVREHQLDGLYLLAIPTARTVDL